MSNKPKSPRKLTEEFLQSVVDQYFKCGEIKVKAADSFGVSQSTFYHWLKRAEQAGMTPSEQPVDKVQEELFALRDLVNALQAELRTTKRDNLSASVVRETIFELKNEPPPQPQWLAKPPRRKPSRIVPSVLWSDWHWGEVVRPEEVNGVNEFNLTIAHQRAKLLTEKVIDICFNHVVDPDYPGIVVNLGGDMISGVIHEELTTTNELPVMPTIRDLVGVLKTALLALADRFGLVFVPCVVGNHGRLSVKPKMKQRVHENFDWLVYTWLEAMLEDDKRIQFRIPDGADCHYTVYQHRYMLTHGDALGVSGGDGIIGSLGPIMRGDFKTRRQAGELGRGYDTLIMGHWHQYLPLVPRLIVNGSLKGFDEFAHLRLRAAPEKPQQALWFTSPDYGITSAWPVFLDAQAKSDITLDRCS